MRSEEVCCGGDHAATELEQLQGQADPPHGHDDTHDPAELLAQPTAMVLDDANGIRRAGTLDCDEDAIEYEHGRGKYGRQVGTVDRAVREHARQRHAAPDICSQRDHQDWQADCGCDRRGS